MSRFDPEVFLNVTTEDALDTTIIPVPEGEYTGIIEDITVRTVQVEGESRGIFRLRWALDDPDGEIRAVTKRDKNFVNQDLWLDITPEGALDFGPGKNVGLGQVRAAVGQNQSGKRWAPSMLKGQPARVLVKHRTSDEDTFAEAKKVMPL